MKSNLFKLLACSALLAASSFSAYAVDPFILPTPENNPDVSYAIVNDATGTPRDAMIMDGIPIAFKYDDFWSYSGKILDSIQTESPDLIPEATYGAYDFSTGTGTIDVNLTSVAGGATNVVTLSDGTTVYFQDPDDLFSNQTIGGWTCDWGGTTQNCTFYADDGTVHTQSYSESADDVGGTTTVGELLSYLQDIDPTWTIPLLYTDYNQTGGGDSLFLAAKVDILDDDGITIIDSFFLDFLSNGNWDPYAPTYNFGDISFEGSLADCIAAGVWDPLTGVGCAGVTDSGATYSGSHNLGSGQADFMAFSYDMDLTLFDPTDIFQVTFYLGCNNVTRALDEAAGGEAGCNTNGGEEFGILGGVAPDRQVPLPGTLLLLGLGLISLSAQRFVKQR